MRRPGNFADQQLATRRVFDQIRGQLGRNQTCPIPVFFVQPHALGGITRFGFDDDSHLTRLSDPAGLSSEMAYDDHGNLLRVTDALGHTTQFAYGEFVADLPTDVATLRRLLVAEWQPEGEYGSVPVEKVRELVAERYGREEWNRRR